MIRSALLDDSPLDGKRFVVFFDWPNVFGHFSYIKLSKNYQTSYLEVFQIRKILTIRWPNWKARADRDGISKYNPNSEIPSALRSETRWRTQYDFLRTCLKTKGATILLSRKYKAQRLDKIAHKENATNANLTCTTCSKEAEVRKQPDKVNNCVWTMLRKSVSG